MSKEFGEGLEGDLFTWDGWDEGGDILSVTFYNPVLKVDIGEDKKGTKFDFASISFEHSTLELGNNKPDGSEAISKTFKLGLIIKEEK